MFNMPRQFPQDNTFNNIQQPGGQYGPDITYGTAPFYETGAPYFEASPYAGMSQFGIMPGGMMAPGTMNQGAIAPSSTMAPFAAAPSAQTGIMPTTPYQPFQVMPALPTGIPTGPTYAAPPETTVPAAEEEAQPGQTVFDVEFTAGYLRTQIGKRVKVEFLIGTNMLVDREGTLVDVGVSYIIIREAETDDLLLCDIYSIKFVRFYY